MDNKYYELSEDTKEIFLDVFNRKAFPVAVSFQFIGNEKQKELVKVTKVNDQYNFILKKELLVSFNETVLDAFDSDESVTILIEQELDKISIDASTGKIKMLKPDLSTFSGLINRYGVKAVARANQITDLLEQQQRDGQVDLV
jgi:hypothetical protein